MSLAMAVPGALYTFVRYYELQPKHDYQRFLLECADHTNSDAQRHTDKHYDAATALITKVEQVHWEEAVVRYVGKGEEFKEAVEKVKSNHVPFDGATISQADVKKTKARLRRSATNRAKSKLASQTRQPNAVRPSLKRKRTNDGSLEDEVKRLAAQARNAGQKHIISEEERRLFVRYLADLPPSVSWNSVLGAFVENGNAGCRYSLPAWAHLLRKDKIWFEKEVALVRAGANKPHA